MSFVFTFIGVVAAFFLSIILGFLISSILKWCRLRIVSPLFFLLTLLGLSKMTQDWTILFLLGMMGLSLWVVVRSVHRRFVLQGIAYAEEQMDFAWGALYGIYFLYAFHQRSFPYEWLQSHLPSPMNSTVVTIIVSVVFALSIISCIYSIMGPYKRLRKHLKSHKSMIRSVLVAELSGTDPSSRMVRSTYLEALIERLILRKKIVEIEQGGYLVLVKYGAHGSSSSSAGNQPATQSARSEVAATVQDHSTQSHPAPVKLPFERAEDSNNRVLTLMRQNFAEHPAANESRKVRWSYVFTIFYGLGDKRRDAALDGLLNEYIVMLGIDPVEENQIRDFEPKSGQAALDRAFRTIRSTRLRKFNWYSYKRISLKHAVFVEFLYMGAMLNSKSFDRQIITMFGKRLGIGSKEQALLQKYCEYLMEDNLKGAQLLLSASFSKKLRARVAFLYDKAELSVDIQHKPKYRTVIIATMSAGKSTFINALLGRNLFPSKNQACTAKITTLVGNDRLDHTIGFTEARNKEVRSYSGVVEPTTLESWNESSELSDIYIEGKMARLPMKKAVPVFVDTPGANYSQDRSHSEVTYRFLESDEFDTIAYLINATQISTDDDRILLTKVLDTMKRRAGKVNIVFLLNKLDEFDLDGEDDIALSVQRLSQDLKGMGFVNPMIIPISAYAAKLMRMAEAQLPLSKKETKDFEAYFRLFVEDKVDFSAYAHLSHTEEQSENEPRSGMLTVGDKTYDRKEIRSALDRTGMRLAENCIARMANI